MTSQKHTTELVGRSSSFLLLLLFLEIFLRAFIRHIYKTFGIIYLVIDLSVADARAVDKQAHRQTELPITVQPGQ